MQHLNSHNREGGDANEVPNEDLLHQHGQGTDVGSLVEYGAGNETRLTCLHETASFEKFSFGVNDRRASICIPCYTVGKVIWKIAYWPLMPILTG
jgi:glutamine synthetase